MPTLPDIFAYLSKLFRSWWLIVPVTVGSVRLFEWLFRHSKPFPIPPRARWSIAISGVLIAQFLAYEDAEKARAVLEREKTSLEGQLKTAKEAPQGSDNATHAPTHLGPKLEITYEGGTLRGRILPIVNGPISTVGERPAQFINFGQIRIKNFADEQTSAVTIRLYLSQITAGNYGGPWQEIPSDETHYPMAYYAESNLYGAVRPVIINPQEAWTWGELNTSLARPTPLTPDVVEVSALAKIFYGTPKPEEIRFVFRKR